MFKHNDRFTLTGINAIDKDGQMIDYHLSFPIDKSTFTIPENIREISVYEYHEGTEKYGYIAFKILVGKITSVRELCSPEIEDFQIDYRAFREIKEADDKLCYYEDDGGVYRVFAKIKPGDIVVNNIVIVYF